MLQQATCLPRVRFPRHGSQSLPGKTLKHTTSTHHVSFDAIRALRMATCVYLSHLETSIHDIGQRMRKREGRLMSGRHGASARRHGLLLRTPPFTKYEHASGRLRENLASIHCNTHAFPSSGPRNRIALYLQNRTSSCSLPLATSSFPSQRRTVSSYHRRALPPRVPRASRGLAQPTFTILPIKTVLLLNTLRHS